MEHPIDIYMTAGTIISSLGFSTAENMSRIRDYCSGITDIVDAPLFNAPFKAARIDEERLRSAVSEQSLEQFTRMEQLFILSLQQTIRQSGVDPSGAACGLILSTTKGNVDLLSAEAIQATEVPSEACLYTMAKRIATRLGCANEPIVVSNACISGVSALLVASRLIEAGKYKHVLVAGGDILTRFVVSGFQSFKSVSPDVCRPYDQSRDGLSLGEACGALLVTSDSSRVTESRRVLFRGGAVTNDANHISGPSRTGDGLYYAIHQAITEAGLTPEELSFVNAHGTATLYNDEMESKALHWAGLDQVPLNSMKSYWGHTLGASGIIETIACMEELCTDEIFGIPGYDVCGVPHPLNISNRHRKALLRNCLKTASGFGGCNAAILLSVATDTAGSAPVRKDASSMPVQETVSVPEAVTYSSRQVLIRDNQVCVDGKVLMETDPSEEFPVFIRSVYRTLGLDDRKFYKMDELCKLGYVAAACLFAANGGTTGYAPQEVGLLVANASSSLDTDLKHQHILDTMGDKEASPAVFVYTLPNVVLGELCIRYKIQGENTFFISDRYPEAFIRSYAEQVMKKQGLKACLIGWCELLGNRYEARFEWLECVINENKYTNLIE